MSKPLVSFVIPVFNSENEIVQCLLSIRNLQFSKEDYEIVIMDNGSIDHTHQIMHDLGFDFHVVPKVNVSALRNRGAAMARGRYVAFIDSDVELSPHWLERALEGFKDPQVVASGCFPRIPEKSTWVQRTWDLQRRGRHHGDHSTSVPWLGSANLIVHRDGFFAVGGFNEHLETAEDVDLCYRLGQHGIILNNPAMEYVHWGEDPDLRTFWSKEVWRGIGNLEGVLSHGICWDELPSLGYPVYIMGTLLLFAFAVLIDLWHHEILLAPVCLFFLGTPALYLAVKTAYLTDCSRATPQLFLLYFVYGHARAFSIVKAWTHYWRNRRMSCQRFRE